MARRHNGAPKQKLKPKTLYENESAIGGFLTGLLFFDLPHAFFPSKPTHNNTSLAAKKVTKNLFGCFCGLPLSTFCSSPCQSLNQARS
jgi:hypothetical protein